jgi:hypothetical protein
VVWIHQIQNDSINPKMVIDVINKIAIDTPVTSQEVKALMSLAPIPLNTSRRVSVLTDSL